VLNNDKEVAITNKEKAGMMAKAFVNIHSPNNSNEEEQQLKLEI